MKKYTENLNTINHSSSSESDNIHDCPNCWGYHEYQGKKTAFFSASLEGTLKKKEPLAFIQKFVEKYIR